MTLLNSYLKVTFKYILFITLLFSTNVFAQDAEDETDEEETIEEVVVTGFRASLESSIATKKNNSSVVEVVTAEDIGKLPDVSIAESIARLPGLTAQRLNGRGQVISVRGLSPDFTTALLNGREQVSSSNNRGVEFDQYPSELIQQVVIYKTPDASLVGQGMGGTADLRTIRPMDVSERRVVFNANFMQPSLGALNAGTEDQGMRYSVSVVDKVSDKFAYAIGIADMQTPTQANKFQAWGYPNIGENGCPDYACGNGPDVTDNFIIGGVKPYVMSNNLERKGMMAILQFNDDYGMEHTIDIYQSEFLEEQIIRGIEFPLAWGWWGSGTAVQPGFTIENGLVTSGTFNNVKGVIRNDLNQRDAEVGSFGWNTKLNLRDGWEGEFDYSLNRVDRIDTVLELNFGTSSGGGNGPFDTMGFINDSTGLRFTSSVIDYADPNVVFLASAQGWGGTGVPGSLREFGQVGYEKSPDINDELSAVRFNIAKDISLGMFSRVEFGWNISERTKDFFIDEYFYAPLGGQPNIPIPSEFIVGSTALEFLGIPGMLSVDPLNFVNNSGLIVREPNTDDDVVIKNWDVSEAVRTIYSELDVDTGVLGVPVMGNVGLAYVSTSQGSTGDAITDDESLSTVVVGGSNYGELYPSMNLTFMLSDNDYLRFAAAKTRARPRMDEMNSTKSFGYNPANAAITDINQSPWSGGGGNPNLKPWEAVAIDVSYEHYWGNQAYVALAYWTKDLENYIYNQPEIFDFSGFPYTGAVEPATRLGLVYTPQNAEGGEINGFEFTASMPLNMVTSLLDGFGAVVTYSGTDSEIELYGPGSGTAIPGLSEDVYNFTLYYEKEGVQARVSNRYRSDFLGEVSGLIGTGREYQTVQAENVVDAQFGYVFGGDQLDGLTIYVQGQNLTDQEFVVFEGGDSRKIRNYEVYGRSITFGFNYKF
jgi:iron complex outermembrane receptor protein